MTHIRNALIEIGHQVARVTPGDVRELLGADLAYTATEFLPGGPLGHRRRNRGRLLHRLHEGALLVPAGLAILVVDTLTKAGFQVAVRDLRRFGPRRTPSRLALDAVWCEEQEFLEAVALEPRGLIEARGAADLAEKAALICQMFPLANVLVVWNAGRKKLLALRGRLQSAAGEAFHLVENYTWPFEGGRLVCSMDHFGMHNGVDFDVVIFADALQTLSPSRAAALARLSCQRVYGFTSLHVGRMSNKSLLRLSANIGAHIYSLPHPEGQEARVRVQWCQPPCSPAPGRVAALERKRIAYWRNDRRNDFVADVARAVAAGDRKTLWQCGLVLARGDDASVSLPAVTVLAESTEHARELLQRLRGWDGIDAVPTAPGRQAKPPRDLWKPRPLDQTVVTYSAAIRMPRIDADVLIHAGGEWTPALYGFPPRSHRPQGEVVLVDLADDFDAGARQAALRRRRDYGGWGWPMVGAPTWLRPPGDDGTCATADRPWVERDADEDRTGKHDEAKGDRRAKPVQ